MEIGNKKLFKHIWPKSLLPYKPKFSGMILWQKAFFGPSIGGPLASNMDDLNKVKSAGGRPKKTSTETLDVKNIHLEWDGCEDIRDRLRNGGGLLVFAGDKKVGDNIPSEVASASVLQPFITRMSLLDSRPLPAVDGLRDEVEAVFLKNKRGETPEDKPDVIEIGWQIRKMLTFLKMKVRRREVSSAPYLILHGLETKK